VPARGIRRPQASAGSPKPTPAGAPARTLAPTPKNAQPGDRHPAPPPSLLTSCWLMLAVVNKTGRRRGGPRARPGCSRLRKRDGFETSLLRSEAAMRLWIASHPPVIGRLRSGRSRFAPCSKRIHRCVGGRLGGVVLLTGDQVAVGDGVRRTPAPPDIVLQRDAGGLRAATGRSPRNSPSSPPRC
jgi:hypothetical protein